MQYFKDETGAIFAYEDDVTVTIVNGISTVTKGSDDTVETFEAPQTLAPTTEPIPPAPTLADRAGAALLAGLSITLFGSTTLAATAFPTDPDSQTKLAAVVLTINTEGVFPGGVSSYPLKDMSGAWHTFTVDQYKAVAGAIAAYAAPLYLIIDGNPLGATILPPDSVSLTV